MNSKLDALQRVLDYEFSNTSLLRMALIHSSYAHEHSMRCDNERLELLGDAVIHLALTEHLLDAYPNENEGSLSSLRSYCESEDFLYERAKELNLGDYVLFGRGEMLGGGKDKKSLLANSYEAVIAAIHLDGGFKTSRKIVMDMLLPHVTAAHESRVYMDAKSELQKLTQRRFGTLPLYEVIKEDGEEHKKSFTVKVTVDKYSLIGSGLTKKSAEKDAAQKLFKIINAE